MEPNTIRAQLAPLNLAAQVALPDTAALVQFPIKASSLADCTKPGPLAAATLAGLRDTFARRNHSPSPAMWQSLGAVADTLEGMAEGTTSPEVHVAALDPGVGKTQAVIHFLRALLASEEHDYVSALVCVGRKVQIEEFIADANLPAETFAVFTADKELNKLGCGSPAEARILFTTHAMVESRCDGRDFSFVEELHYRRRARDVRVWDEACLPGRVLTVSRDDIASLRKPLRRPFSALTDALEAFDAFLGTVDDGKQIIVPDLASDYGVSLNDAHRVLPSGVERPELKAAVDGLWFLFGKCVTVRREGRYGNTMLDFRDTLPQDIVPLLVLDASARVRETYSLWEDQRGGLVRLPPAPKSYAPLTIHVWQTSGGKDAFRKNGDELVEGIANTIKTKPTERWLVVYHKGIGREIDRDVMSLLPGVDADAVRFLNWGAHEATNAYADIPNVILAGTLFYGSAFYEALGRAAAGRPSEDGPFSTEAYQAVMRGEHRHLILQALCRGVVRKCRGNVCPKSDAYIIASVRSGIAQELPAIFPGARMVRWKPVARKLSGKVGAAAAFVIDAINSGTEHVSFAAVRKHVAITNTSNFNKVVRRHSSFVEALAERGIAEWPKVRPTGFRNEHDAYFGTTTDKEPSP